MEMLQAWMYTLSGQVNHRFPFQQFPRRARQGTGQTRPKGHPGRKIQRSEASESYSGRLTCVVIHRRHAGRFCGPSGGEKKSSCADSDARCRGGDKGCYPRRACMDGYRVISKRVFCRVCMRSNRLMLFVIQESGCTGLEVAGLS